MSKSPRQAVVLCENSNEERSIIVALADVKHLRLRTMPLLFRIRRLGQSGAGHQSAVDPPRREACPLFCVRRLMPWRWRPELPVQFARVVRVVE
jgi:hypothetical protein